MYPSCVGATLEDESLRDEYNRKPMENAQERPFDWGDMQKHAEEQGDDEFNPYSHPYRPQVFTYLLRHARILDALGSEGKHAFPQCP